MNFNDEIMNLGYKHKIMIIKIMNTNILSYFLPRYDFNSGFIVYFSLKTSNCADEITSNNLDKQLLLNSVSFLVVEISFSTHL